MATGSKIRGATVRSPMLLSCYCAILAKLEDLGHLDVPDLQCKGEIDLYNKQHVGQGARRTGPFVPKKVGTRKKSKKWVNIVTVDNPYFTSIWILQ